MIVSGGERCAAFTWQRCKAISASTARSANADTCACLAAGKYTLFAQVIDGLEVLDKMEKIQTGGCSHAHMLA